jgi:hypothetical protein
VGSYPEERVDGAAKPKVGFPQGVKKSSSEWKRERKLKGGGSTGVSAARDRERGRDPHSSQKKNGPGREGSPKIDISWENWDEQKLDYDDELMLEKKRQMLERELAKHGDDDVPSASAEGNLAPGASEPVNRKRKLDQPPSGVTAKALNQDSEKARTGRGPESDSESAASSASENKGSARSSSAASSVGSAHGKWKMEGKMLSISTVFINIFCFYFSSSQKAEATAASQS